MYKLLLNDLPYNNSCCGNPVINVIIDLKTNTVEFEPYYFIPVTINNGTPNTSDFNMGWGYIKMPKSDYENYIKTQKYTVENNSNYKKYQIYYNFYGNSINDIDKILQKHLYVFADKLLLTGEYDITNQIPLFWNDKVILKINNKQITFPVYNFKQVFVKWY